MDSYIYAVSIVTKEVLRCDLYVLFIIKGPTIFYERLFALITLSGHKMRDGFISTVNSSEGIQNDY